MSTVLTTDDLAATSRRDARLLAAFVCASLALHATLIVTLPGRMRADERAVPLEVTFERIEPPRPLPMAPREPPRPEKRPQERPPPVQERIVRPQLEPQPQLLALPKQANVPEPAFTIPIPEPQPAAEAPARETARAATRGEGVPGEKITPPTFNAAYLRNPKPQYPPISQRRGEQGTVLVNVLVTRDGAAASVKLEKTSGHAALDQAALGAVRNWRFTPARQGSEAIESSVIVPIVFRLEGVS